ncbi:MAG: protoporphyrinogen oxidase HemJ [Deltaproteobacteria bacterium]|nr:MAG: protoporphyrinogen oxidase HemJ [Deltaproteobacteria bacterium]
MDYLIVKSLHIISVISWMAGLLYLPRLFVYHSSEQFSPATSSTFKVMERRLLRYIMTPAMIASWIFGLYIAFIMGYFSTWPFWFALKMFLVLAMTAVHVVLRHHVLEFEKDANRRPQVYFRVLNEVPTLLMVVIVFAVVMKDV